MVTISINLLFSIGCENRGDGECPSATCPDRTDTRNPNKRIHIVYCPFTALTHCLMYVFPEQGRGNLEGNPVEGIN